jgi:hypothetical protein
MIKIESIQEEIEKEVKRLEECGGMGEDCRATTVLYVALHNIADRYRPITAEQKAIAENLLCF